MPTISNNQQNTLSNPSMNLFGNKPNLENSLSSNTNDLFG